jgi:hypothetical protein
VSHEKGEWERKKKRNKRMGNKKKKKRKRNRRMGKMTWISEVTYSRPLDASNSLD